MGSEKVKKYRFVGSVADASEYQTGAGPVYGQVYNEDCTWFSPNGTATVGDFAEHYSQEWELVEEGGFSIEGTVASEKAVEGLNKLVEAIDNSLYSDPFYCYLLGMEAISDDVHGTLETIMKTYKKYYQYGHI